MQKDTKKEVVKNDGAKNNDLIDTGKENQKPHHRRGHRGGRKHAGKSTGKEQNQQSGQPSDASQKTQIQKTDA